MNTKVGLERRPYVCYFGESGCSRDVGFEEATTLSDPFLHREILSNTGDITYAGPLSVINRTACC